MSYPWASGEVLTAADLNAYAGLVLVKTQTIGTAVASVTVSNAFSSTFESYRIVWSGGTNSSNQGTYLQLGASTTGYYNGWAGCFYTGTANNGAQNNAASILVGGGDGFTATVVCDVSNPFNAQYTTFRFSAVFVDVGIAGAGRHAVATSYTGFTLAPASGTMTGGTIRVYGYNNG